MRDLGGKTAFVTGGASGIGLALGRAFAEAGMQVMLADIEAAALARAVESLHGLGPDVRGVIPAALSIDRFRSACRAAGISLILRAAAPPTPRAYQSSLRAAGITCDVADPASLEHAAEATYQAFGNVHMVCNNAGVAGGSGIEDIALGTWRWVLDVNLMGVVHGIRTFLPHLRAHGEGGHIINTASMAGLASGLGLSPYSASKFAVVAISEGLAKQVAPIGIGVTVLCPGFVRTRIAESGRNRPERYGPPHVPDPASPAGKLAARQAELGQSGLDPSDVAAQVLAAIRADELYVFTHTGVEWRAELQARFDAIMRAMDKAATRPRT